MGAMKEIKEGKRGKGRKRDRKTGNPADWGRINPEYIYWAVCSVTRAGGAIRLGKSRDGNVYNIGVYDQDEYWNEWAESDESCAAKLDEISRLFTDPDGENASSGETP